MKTVRKVISALSSAAIMCGVLASCGNLMPVEEDVMPPPISQPEDVVYVTEPVALGNIQSTIYCVGSFVSTQSADLAFQLEQGTFSKFYVEKGDTVKKGQLLAEAENSTIAEQIDALETSIYRSDLQNDYNVKRLKVSLEKSKANLKSMKTSLSDYQNQLSVLKSELNALENKLADIKAGTYTGTDGATADSVSADITAKKAEISQMNTTIASQKTAISDAANELDLEQQNYDMQVTFVNLDTDDANEQLTKYKEQLAQTQLLAPFDGTITFESGIIYGEPVGEDIVVMKISDPNSLIFQYPVSDETYIPYFYSGREVEINVNGVLIKGSVVQGTADVPASITDTESATYSEEDSVTVYISVPSVPETIEMGTTGSMTIVTDEAQNVIVVSRSYIETTGSGEDIGYYVYVIKEGLPTMRTIELGIMNTSDAEVVSGLEVGEEILVG